jgi:hypothetical protein
MTTHQADTLSNDLHDIERLYPLVHVLATTRTPGQVMVRRPSPGPRSPVRLDILDLTDTRPERDWPDIDDIDGDTDSPARVLTLWWCWVCDVVDPLAIPDLSRPCRTCDGKGWLTWAHGGYICAVCNATGRAEADDATMAVPGNLARMILANLKAIVRSPDERAELLAGDIHRVAARIRAAHGEVLPGATPCPVCGEATRAAGPSLLTCTSPTCAWQRHAPQVMTAANIVATMIDIYGDEAPRPSTVRSWIHRGELPPIFRDTDGYNLFRLDQARSLWGARMAARRTRKGR